MSEAAREYVILVDEHDQTIGREEKIRAHQDGGLLHRAFSIAIFDPRGRMLLQRRAGSKYHFPGLWSNTCCGHPRPEESIEQAAHRRLVEEMGFDVPLECVGKFRYRAFDSATQLYEHEWDHVLIGRYDAAPIPNPMETDEWHWIDLDELRRRMAVNAAQFTPWLRLVLEALPAGGGDSLT